MELIFASNNNHKLKEMRQILGKGFNLSGLKDIGYTKEIPEYAITLEGNADIKAKTIFDFTGKTCFADDTGLEVKALNNRPGVYSARYAGENCSFSDNLNKLLKEMKGIKNREARFRTVICLITPENKYFFEGIVNGYIAYSSSGNGGFGYDPVFIPEGYDSSFAEMDAVTKNKISHRGIATQKLTNFIKKKYGINNKN